MLYLEKILNSPVGSALKVFVAVFLTMLVADWSNHGSIDWDSWQLWVIAGLASAVPVVVNWLNPSDPRYGSGANTNANNTMVDHDG
jgi:hypothetical protein